MDLLFENKLVRRLCIAVFFLPLGFLAWDAPWAMAAYMATCPLLFLSYGLWMIDLHLSSKPDLGPAARPTGDR